ncbi:MAG: PorP/SprF family type IX secretion system membrane protein [Bacteroidota bacterium]|nr:PorP/SprF family type IX secretion system membrane protein [Bacteroidota bacterium]
MKKVILLVFFFACFYGYSQQTNRYTQYTLNNIGMNPAYAGSYQNKVEFMVGRRNQWYGFSGAPTTTFFSANYGYRANYSYKGWHGFSAYVEEDKVAAFTNKSAYLGYAYHMRIFTGVNLGFGLMAGIRTFGLSNAAANSLDPAFQFTKQVVRAYPDFIPGFRMYSKKMFLDVSVRQLYVNRMQQGSKKIGTSDAKLQPHYYITYGRKIHSGYNNFMFVPSVHIQSSLLAIPQVDVNCMVYYHKRIGVGANYRVNNSFSGIVQVNISKNIVAGFSYDYTTTKFRNAAANTYEFMIGVSPVMMGDEKPNKNRVANCPTFDF